MHLFTALHRMRTLRHSVVIMRSFTIFSRSTIKKQHLAYSFNTLITSTSFDAQNIVSELLPSPKAYHGASAIQLHPDVS
jgi:hypothetical protein